MILGGEGPQAPWRLFPLSGEALPSPSLPLLGPCQQQGVCNRTVTLVSFCPQTAASLLLENSQKPEHDLA